MSRKDSNNTVFEESTEYCDHDFDRYCNYPDISKPINKLGFSRYSTEDTETSSSNDVSSLSAYSLFSDGVSSVADRNYTISTVKLLPSSRTCTKLSDESSDVESSATSTEEVNKSRPSFTQIYPLMFFTHLPSLVTHTQ